MYETLTYSMVMQWSNRMKNSSHKKVLISRPQNTDDYFKRGITGQ